MPKQTRRNHSAAVKAKVALETLRGEKTVSELSAKYGVHPTLINRWRRMLSEQVSVVFEKDGGPDEKKTEQLVDTLYKQIGQLKVENDWLS